MSLLDHLPEPAQDVLPGISVREPEYTERLLPAKRFPDELAGGGRGPDASSPTLDEQARAMSAGWPLPANGEEVHDAMHEPYPDRRQRALIRAWTHTATEAQLLAAWRERAWSLRTLAGALHRAGVHGGRLAVLLNPLAVRGRRS